MGRGRGADGPGPGRPAEGAPLRLSRVVGRALLSLAGARARRCSDARGGRSRRASSQPGAAALTASAVGPLTATTAAKPAAQAFWTISKLARLLTTSAEVVGGQASIEEQAPHHLVDRVVAPDVLSRHDHVTGTVEGRGGVHRARGREERLRSEPTAGETGQGRRREDTGRSRGSGGRRAASSSSSVEPQNPQLELVTVSRGVGHRRAGHRSRR